MYIHMLSEAMVSPLAGLLFIHSMLCVRQTTVARETKG